MQKPRSPPAARLQLERQLELQFALQLELQLGLQLELQLECRPPAAHLDVVPWPACVKADPELVTGLEDGADCTRLRVNPVWHCRVLPDVAHMEAPATARTQDTFSP
jgi:hypothetical protein